MQYSIHKTSLGFPLVTIPMPSLASVCLTVWVLVGSRYETENLQGISHFLEHMAFKGGKKFKNSQIVSETLEGLGASYNAATGRETTSYYIKLRSELLEKAFDILSDMILHPLFPENDLEKERGVILEELAMTDDNPQERVGLIFSELMYGKHPLGRNIAGTPKVIKSMTKNDILRYKDTYYVNDNIIISIAGNFDEREALKLTEKYFSDVKIGKKRSYLPYKAIQTAPKLIIENKPIQQANILLGFPAYKYDHKMRMVEQLLSIIMGGGMSSRLFKEVREKRGLAYAIGSYTSIRKDTGKYINYVGVNPDNAVKTIDIILNEQKNLSKNIKKISQKELTKVKEFMKGNLALSLENTSAVSNFIVGQMVYGKKIMTPEDIYKEVDEVTIGQIQECAEYIFNNHRANLAIVGPFSDSDKIKFEKLL